MAMALRAGLTLRDMEMVQFHPTGLLAGAAHAHDRHGARGRPARRRRLSARTARASASCSDYDPRGERATRDIVSRAIFAEMRAGRTHAATAASTSACAISARTTCARQFKGMVERCADCGFDLAGGLVEVVPTAHYMMGGVVFSADCTTDAARPVRGRRGYRRRARREPARRQRRRQLDRVRRHRRRDAWRRGLRAASAHARARRRRRSSASVARAEAPLRQRAGRSRGDSRGALRHACGTTSASCATRRRPASARSARARRARRRARRDAASPTATARSTSTWHDWLNLRSLMPCQQRDRASRRWRARIRAARISARISRTPASCRARPISSSDRPNAGS